MRTIATILFLALLPACITPKAHEKPKSTQELRVVLQDFHMKMRWGLWEQAVQYTTDNYRNEFLGRYEELGEDFKITDLQIKTVTLGDPITTVEVEQQWYVEPDMTVHKKRYIESWVNLNGLWRINERIPKSEFRERMQGKTDKEEAQPDPAETSGTPDSGAPPATTQPEQR
jgi:hypothetical protein